MSLNLVVSVLGEEAVPRRPLWVPNAKQPVAAVRRVIEAMFKSLDNHRRKRRRKEDTSYNLRLFFNGHELEDGYSMEAYDLADGNVIQVKRVETNNGQLENEINQLSLSPSVNNKLQHEITTSVTSDLFYSINEHIDALDDESGAWFPAKITSIINNSPNENTYLVSYRKPSLGALVPRTLAQIRPPSTQMITSFTELNPGQAVLVLVEKLWFVGLVEQTTRDWRYTKVRKGGGGKVVLSLVRSASSTSTGTVFEQYVHQFKVGTMIHLQTTVLKSERSDYLEETIKNGVPLNSRFYDPDCTFCDDAPSLEQCNSCGCQVCSYKSRPEEQLVCDECDRATHISCLKVPLSDVPKDEEWYCDQCRTETTEEVIQQSREHLQKRGKKMSSNWGFGMSTASSGTSAKDSPKFGPIKGVPVGAWWRYRVQAAQTGVHRPLVASVHGSQNRGAYSLLFSAALPEDVDLGEELYYTAASESRNRKRKSISGQQKLTHQNKALALNCAAPLSSGLSGTSAGANWRDGRPVRLCRSGNGRNAHQRSPYLPKVGVRYDGLYQVVKYWWEEGVWRFHLRRDDPEPSPWTEAGRYRAKKNGYLTPVYPQGWTMEMAGKRKLTVDLKILDRKAKLMEKVSKELSPEKVPSTSWSIPESIVALIKQDIAHQTQWSELLRLAEEQGKEAFFNRLAETFICICCLEPLTNLKPVTMPICGHSLCQCCLKRVIEEAELNSCPLCRSGPLPVKVKVDTTLERILQQITNQ